MRGVYLVAAELAARGLVASPTSRSAAGADLLVTDERCANAYSVQVKTNAKSAGFWLVGPKSLGIASDSHIYVFVNLKSAGDHEYYVVPSAFVASHIKVRHRPRSSWYEFLKSSAAGYRDRWDLLAGRSTE
jgi:hypothetical protein